MKIAMLGIKGIPVPAGAENVAEQIGTRLVQKGHQVTIYVRSHYTPKDLTEYKGMRLVHLPSIPTKNLDAITHSFFASWAAIFSDADVIHIHSTGNSIFSLIPRAFGKKTIVQSHGLDWQRAKWGKFAKLYLKLTDYSTVHFPNAVTAVSKKMTSYYQGLTKRPVIYIPNGVDSKTKRSAKLIHQFGLTENEYILFAARFVPEKGAHHLIKAFQQIKSTKKLVMAGDGSYGDRYADELKSAASDKIIFPGFVQGELLEELLSHAYLYVLPSDIEGLSTGLLEAMSYGNCVLVSNIEENMEAIGENGVAFNAGDASDLAINLEYLLQNPEVVKLYQQKAEEHARRLFDWDIITNQIESLYLDIKK